MPQFHKHSLKYREIRKRLSEFGIKEEKSRGKGSHRIFSHPNFRGKPRFYPVPCHGENEDLSVKVCDAIARAFDLKPEEIYAKKLKK